MQPTNFVEWDLMPLPFLAYSKHMKISLSASLDFVEGVI
jgi:hypothetical protein